MKEAFESLGYVAATVLLICGTLGIVFLGIKLVMLLFTFIF